MFFEYVREWPPGNGVAPVKEEHGAVLHAHGR